jgi:phosphoribosylformylglycinamidine cyclo-ligase
MGETYERAGVSLAAADDTVERLKPHVRSTFRPGVLSDVGTFGSLVAVPSAYREPVLVSSTDGVGTKLKVAEAAGRFDTIGIDLVAMCVDDIAVQGADPLFFLDYVGVGRLVPSVVEQIVAGVAEGCRLAGCALVGGEVAEHGEGHSMDVAGFAVGVVERAAVITGASISPGDVVVGLASPGLRSNGYSLARKVLLSRSEQQLLDPAWEGASSSLADELLRPSLIYSPAMAQLRAAVDVRGFAHVTGGGIEANLARILPPSCDALIRWGSWPVPTIFGEIQRRGEVSDDEMAKVFNLGVGMIAVVPADAAASAMDVLGEAFVIGGVTAGTGAVTLDRG